MNAAVSAEHLASHRPAAIARRLRRPPGHGYLRDFVFGAIDGIVTTFAVVSGVAGAGLSSEVVLILGAANLFGDGLSMAAGNYLATKADADLRVRARNAEADHIATYPEGEREEVRQIYRRKGFSGEALEHAVATITADRERWINTMLVEELGVPLDGPRPLRAGVVTFFAFVACGAAPLLPFVAALVAPDGAMAPYETSSLFALAAFFGVGAFKSRFLDQHWARSGAETLLIGAAAAGAAYLAGWGIAAAIG